MENYNLNEKIPRLLGNCGHSICDECLDNYLVALKDKFKTFNRFILKCPFDNTDHFVKSETTSKDFPKNLTIIDILNGTNEKEK